MKLQTDTICQTDGPLVPMVGLVPVEKDVIPMVLLMNMHLINLAKYNRSPLNEMHIHQQNHWNDIIFYWYQSHHWYQRTIEIALYPARSHGKII